MSRRLWHVATHVNTIVHEGAHALVGLGTRRAIRGVKINTDGGGTIISIGRIVAVLWLGLLLLAAMLLMICNLFGGIVILACGVLLYLIVWHATVGVETAVAHGVTWFLLVSGP